MFIGYYSVANAVTLLGLLSATMSCFLSAQKNFKFAIIMLFLAAVCDMFDGAIARSSGKERSRRQTVYGVQLDSLCDVISFGVAPCFIAYNLGFSSVLDIIIYLLFIACGAIRLAYFNTSASETQGPVKYFRGVPIPVSSFVLPILMLMMIFIEHSPMTWIFRICFFLNALAFILKIKIKKPPLRVSTILVCVQLIVIFVILVAGDLKM